MVLAHAQIMGVGTNVPTTFWSTAGEQPHNPGNEPFLKFLMAVATTSGAGMPKTLSVSYGDDEPGVWYDCTYHEGVGPGIVRAVAPSRSQHVASSSDRRCACERRVPDGRCVSCSKSYPTCGYNSLTM